MVIAQAKLKWGADHARRLDSANLGSLEPLRLAAAGAEEPCTLARECDLLARRHVGGAADHGCRLAIAQLHRGKAQPVGVGVRLHFQHVAYHQLVALPVAADKFDLADFIAGHGQPVRELAHREVDGYVLSQPGQGYFHLVSLTYRFFSIEPGQILAYL